MNPLGILIFELSAHAQMTQILNYQNNINFHQYLIYCKLDYFIQCIDEIAAVVITRVYRE